MEKIPVSPILRSVVIVTTLSLMGFSYSYGQAAANDLGELKHDRVYTFLLKDGSCKFGELAKSDKQSVTIRSTGNPDASIPVADLLQMGQGSELFYDSRSSWLDVQGAKLYARESMLVTMNNGEVISGKPQKVDADTLTIERPFSTKMIRKEDVRSIVTLKLRPATASFEFVQEEAGFFQIFYPEFYERAFRSEGRVPVRLYDSSLPEDDSEGIARCNPRHISGYKP
jgi:hypothetical protein